MSLQFLILETLLAFALIGTVVTCVDDYYLEKFKRILFENALRSMKFSLKYRLNANDCTLYPINKREKNSIWEVSVVLENDCKPLKYPKKRCDIYVTQDQSGYITTKDKPEQCRYIGNNLDQNKDGIDREPVLTFFGDKIVEEIFQKGSLRYISEYRNHEVLSTSMINATEQRVEGGTMYEVNYKLIELSCRLVGMARDCIEDENSRIRYCKIEVLKNSHISIEQTPVMTTCEDKYPINVVQI